VLGEWSGGRRAERDGEGARSIGDEREVTKKGKQKGNATQ
jgi:hypothetical protein